MCIKVYIQILNAFDIVCNDTCWHIFKVKCWLLVIFTLDLYTHVHDAATVKVVSFFVITVTTPYNCLSL